MDIFVDITKSNIPEIIKKAEDNKEMNFRKWWWARDDSNIRPLLYQSSALTDWATGPN